MRTYYEKNKKKVLEYQKKYRLNNLKKIREKQKNYSKEYYLKNTEKIKERRKNTRKTLTEYHRIWRRKKGIKPRIKLTEKEKQERKKRKLEQSRQWNEKRRLKLRIEIFSRDNFTCLCCGRKPPEVKLQIDHIHPKSKGGLDEIKNYQTLCEDCNLGKGDDILEEFV